MKTENKHTPGPWGLNKSTDIWIKAGPVHVATIPRAYDGDWSEANARLIAAAPDLLESLELALDTIEGQAELLRACGAAYGIGATLQAARLAISKATQP